MKGPSSHLDVVGELFEALARLGLESVLVGGMALVVLGSRRVTRDFDLLVARPGDGFGPLVDVLYDQGLELASRVSSEGDVTATIASRKMAAARLRLDAPANASFLVPESGLRVDLLFDFPLAASSLARRAKTVTVRSRRWPVASEEDLLRLKKLAQAGRSTPGDAEDVGFLESRLAKRRS